MNSSILGSIRLQRQGPVGGVTPEPETSFSFSSIQPGTLNQVAITFKVDPGYVCYINFGDGAGNRLITADGHDATVTSTYSTINTTYPITVSGHLGRMRKFRIATEATVANLNIDDFKTNGVGLSYLHIAGTATSITGSLNNLPLELCYLYLETIGTSVTGSPSSLPVGLYHLYLNGTTGISGSINSLPTDIYLLWLRSVGSGLTGSIDNLPVGITNLRIEQVTTLTGLVQNLPAGLLNCYLFAIGNNIAGNISSLPPLISNLTIRRSLAGGAYTGSINSLPVGLTNLYLVNLGTSITGDFELLPATLSTDITIQDCGTNINYSGGAVPAWASVTMTVHVGFTATELDNFLISWASTAGVGTKAINLAGTNAARTAASNAAVTTLNGKGKTITTN